MNPKSTKEYQAAKITGDIKAIVDGLGLIIAGGAQISGGVGMTVATDGAAIVPGAGLAVTGVATAGYGAGVTYNGATNLWNDAAEYMSGNGSSGSSSKTIHGEQRAQERGFNNEKISDIQQNYSQKVYQPNGRTVYAKKNGNYYDVIITNRNGEVITTVGGNTKSLRNWNDVTKMLKNNGGYTSIPMD